MNLRILSDLHLEIHPYIIPLMQDEANQILILAGDICPLVNFEKHKLFFEDSVKRFKKVLYVFGNHEYYGGNIQDEENYTELLNMLGVEVINDYRSSIFDNHFIHGGTLWTDYGNNPMDELQCAMGMSDFRAIRNGDRSLSTADCKKMFKHTVSQLDHDLTGSIVVTHHSPSYQGLSSKYKGNCLNSGFHSNLDELILNRKPKLWIHGHTHDSLDYMIGDTRVICNPRGYASSHHNENQNFNPFLVVTV